MVRVLLIFVAIGFGPPVPVDAQRSDPGRSERLRALIAEANLGNDIGIHVVRATDGSELFAHNAVVPRNPASNMKLITSAVALLALGPDFSMRTALLGRPEGHHIDTLVLRGYGDPSLRLSTFVELAQGLAGRGIESVGTLLVDGTYFDAEFLPPAFEQQPGELAAFRASIAAVSVERSAYVLRVLPASDVGDPGEIRLAVPGYFETVGSIQTTARGRPPNVIVDHDGLGPRMTLRLSGTVPQGAREVAYALRVNHPLYYAGHAMVEALRRVGIDTGGGVQVGPRPDGLAVLTQHRSEPLANLLDALGKRSDNFAAEMLLKVIGAEDHEPGTTERGLENVVRHLESAGVDTDGLRLVNGSGLFDGNRVAPVHLTQLLHRMWINPTFRSEFVAHLAVPGEAGTLLRRLADLPSRRLVRAKTGTLRDAVALSGYVLDAAPERAVAFSILLNGVSGRQARARQLADDIVRALSEAE